MEQRDIATRQDIEVLVHTFYGKVMEHPGIGPFFNQTIEDWEEHLHKLTDFWETNLFFIKAYKGNPLRAHLEVDKGFGHHIEQAHFEQWLEIWFNTIDHLYYGTNADLAKERARSMAHIMFIRIYQAREKEVGNA